ncbi:MAG: MBL fold metallo-hydrolase [Deltaproteobacteria bacterium]|nr:MBL fold metallo-hydrolase [Deltaproteobacteria bacterium]
MTFKRFLPAFLISAVFGFTAVGASVASPAGDAEALTHGDEAASLQLVEQETLPDFIFRQYNLAVLSHYSYMIGSRGEAMIIDPSRDIDRYVKDAVQLGFRITRVYLTHSHADFVAGHTELMAATGAEIIVNEALGAQYPHNALPDGGEIRFGNVRAVVVTTPGHTPDGSCLYVYHPANSAEPKMVLTGDTLFIGGVGRPDLLEGSYSSAQLAALLFETWEQKLSEVPDETRLYPAHGAGSLCGAHLSDEPVSTFGEQKRSNPYLQHKDLSSFVMAVISGLGDPPQYFGHNAAMNRKGPPVVDWSRRMPPALSADQVSRKEKTGAWLIDIRDAMDFSDGHVPGALNIDIRGRFETWMGIMVPWGEPFVLIGPDNLVSEAVFRLHRIGYDEPAGYLKGGMDIWKAAGRDLETVTLVSPGELHRQMQEGTAPIIVDVRLPNEWMSLRIGDVLNMPLNRLFREAHRLDPSLPVLMVCNSAYRSSLAAGIVQKLGFEDVRNLEGGSQAWIDAGLPTYGAEASKKTSPGVFVNLPERMSPQDLARWITDLPGSIEVVDIRPAWQFAEYHIPGAVNAPVQDVMTNPVYLVGKRPLVIVCRDGSLSAAVGGALVQKSPRPVSDRRGLPIL